MNREEIPVVRNIFIGIMLVTCIAGYDIARYNEKLEVKAQEVQVAVSGPTSTPKAITEAQETPESYIREVFGYEQGERLIYMLKTCENKTLNFSNFTEKNIKNENWNGNGTWDYGLLQINQVHGYTKEQLADYKFNIEAGYRIYKNAGYSFSPWTCSYVLNETPFYLK